MGIPVLRIKTWKDRKVWDIKKEKKKKLQGFNSQMKTHQLN